MKFSPNGNEDESALMTLRRYRCWIVIYQSYKIKCLLQKEIAFNLKFS